MLPQIGFKAVLLFTLIFWLSACTSVKPVTLEAYLQENNAIAKKYLLSLKPSDIKQKIRGVFLTDNTEFLKDYKLLKKRFTDTNKTHIFLFKKPGSGADVAYIWVDSGGIPFQLSNCHSPNNHMPGWAGAVLSGDVYTYSTVNPGSDVVSTHCIDKLFSE